MEIGGESRPPDIEGQPLETAVESLLAYSPHVDESRARALLHPVSSDGIVSREAVEDELAHLAKVVSTPETRAELAAIALTDARESAENVPDLAIVESRLVTFEKRLSTIETEVQTLGSDLQDLVESDRSTVPIIDLAQDIQRIRSEANGLQQAADELQVDLESFEEWLDDPDRRVSELTEDIEILAEMLEGLSETIDGVDDISTSETASTSESEPATHWLEAWISYRVTGLLLSDIRLEYQQLEAWHREEELDQPTIDDRLDALETTRNEIGDRLNAIAKPEWQDRHNYRLDAIDDTLDSFEAPVDWDEVQYALDRLRS